MTACTDAPPLLDRDGIARRIPHAGRMCLLQRLEAWDAESITCSTRSHHDPDNPLRQGGVLWAPSAIEYAAQAMALHGALIAPATAAPRPGYIASVRSVQLHALRLDGAPGALQVQARRLAGDARQVLYALRVADAQGRVLAEGRAAVVLNSPLVPPPQEPTP